MKPPNFILFFLLLLVQRIIIEDKSTALGQREFNSIVLKNGFDNLAPKNKTNKKSNLLHPWCPPLHKENGKEQGCWRERAFHLPGQVTGPVTSCYHLPSLWEGTRCDPT